MSFGVQVQKVLVWQSHPLQSPLPKTQSLVDGLLGGSHCLGNGLSRKKSGDWSGFLK